MPKEPKTDEAATAAPDTLPKTQGAGRRVEKECPNCRANIFQGPYNRGLIVDGAFVVRETIVQCVNCHKVYELAELHDRVIDPAGQGFI